MITPEQIRATAAFQTNRALARVLTDAADRIEALTAGAEMVASMAGSEHMRALVARAALTAGTRADFDRAIALASSTVHPLPAAKGGAR